jgi:putative phosphoribosyl transferase
MPLKKVTPMEHISNDIIQVPTGESILGGELSIPEEARGIVLFCHGRGNRRHGPNNRRLAAALRENGLGTVVLDLLTPAEEAIDKRTGRLRFETRVLAARLVDIIDALGKDDRTRELPLALFAASTAAAAALVTAAVRPLVVRAVVSLGGRPELAEPALREVESPTLLIVGEEDRAVMDLNREALARIRAEKSLLVIPGATHLFSEPGALEEVASLASHWFQHYLALVPERA